MTVEGRVDANTSRELQDAIITAFQSANKLVVDFAKVEYVASAGLRALLLGQKNGGVKGRLHEACPRCRGSHGSAEHDRLCLDSHNRVKTVLALWKTRRDRT